MFEKTVSQPNEILDISNNNMSMTTSKKPDLPPPLTDYSKLMAKQGDSDEVDIEFSSDEDNNSSCNGDAKSRTLHRSISDVKSKFHVEFNNDR